MSDETKVEKTTNDDGNSVSQPIAKPHVGCSLSLSNVTNSELFKELQQRGFYVSKVSQDEENGIDYLVVSAQPVKVKEVYYTERKDWSVDYGDGKEAI